VTGRANNARQLGEWERASYARGPVPRSAFTLLEVLLATGLSLVLMVAVYAALELYYRYSRVGQEEMERCQIARAVLNRMATDIRSVVYRRNEQEGQDEANNTADSQDMITVEVVDPDEAYLSESVGVFGDSQTLVLHISRPQAALLVDESDADTATASSDLQSVSYFLVGTESDSALQQLVASELANEESEDEEPATGLARLQGNRLAMTMADEEGHLQTMAEKTQLLAEEIDFLQFEYFDGTEWVDEWDTVQYGGLPKAIAITIGFRAPEESPSLLFGGTVGASTDQYRLVVALPLAETTEETESTTY